jgi:hypothetical protein
MGVIGGHEKGNIFARGDWTGQIRLIWFRKIVFWRNGPGGENAARQVARMSRAICGIHLLAEWPPLSLEHELNVGVGRQRAMLQGQRWADLC